MPDHPSCGRTHITKARQEETAPRERPWARTSPPHPARAFQCHPRAGPRRYLHLPNVLSLHTFHHGVHSLLHSELLHLRHGEPGPRRVGARVHSLRPAPYLTPRPSPPPAPVPDPPIAPPPISRPAPRLPALRRFATPPSHSVPPLHMNPTPLSRRRVTAKSIGYLAPPPGHRATCSQHALPSRALIAPWCPDCTRSNFFIRAKPFPLSCSFQLKTKTNKKINVIISSWVYSLTCYYSALVSFCCGVELDYIPQFVYSISQLVGIFVELLVTVNKGFS